jgi:uncharacterized protein YozE (UPF0346 family)
MIVVFDNLYNVYIIIENTENINLVSSYLENHTEHRCHHFLNLILRMIL